MAEQSVAIWNVEQVMEQVGDFRLAPADAWLGRLHKYAIQLQIHECPDTLAPCTPAACLR